MPSETERTPMPAEHRRVIVASSLGAMFEWYDFYLYGVLAPVFAQQFFAGPGERTALVATLLAFAAGFVVRPVGALVFGRLGDLIGRKYTFLVTLVLMGGATFAIGLLPGIRHHRPGRAGVAGAAAACCRAWRSAANTVAWPPTWPSMRRRSAAASTPAGSRRRRASACCWPCWPAWGCAVGWANRRSPTGVGGCRSWRRWCCSWSASGSASA